MLRTFGWTILALVVAAGAIEGAFQLVTRMTSWRSSAASRARWVIGATLVCVALIAFVYLEYEVRPPVSSSPHTPSKESSGTGGTELTHTDVPPSTTSTATISMSIVPEGETRLIPRERADDQPPASSTETASSAAVAEEYLRATTGLEKQRPADIDSILDPGQITELIKQTGRGASNWFLLADGPVRIFCISGSDNQLTSLSCPQTPCDLNRLPFCHHVRVKNEKEDGAVRVRIWYYNPFRS